ncbi:MAG TPA: hypothetical protein VH394_23955 [Thermoanaerobaculia bacterium]|nr:hypothetical protein [Thermoanaerobaculia bacterium]
MRHIDTSSLRDKLPAGWEARAQAALEAARKADPEDRPALLTKYAPVWQEIKHILEELSYNKCWYCESVQIRSDNAVDHFRPKNRVVEADNGHEGYWWLAFELKNYRFSCQLCNSRRKDRETGHSGGKHDHFPIFDEACRAFTEADDLRRERPKLLDPTNIADTTLLWFEPDGRVVEKYDKDRHPRPYERANVSIGLYHLNESKAKSRRRDLHQELLNLIDEGNEQFLEFESGNLAAELAYASVIKKIHKLLDPKSEYSAAARALLLSYCDADHPWIEAILTVM